MRIVKKNQAKKYMIDYLKFISENINNDIVKECYYEMFKDSPIMCEVHSDYFFPKEFPMSPLFFSKEIPKNYIKKDTIKKYEPKYTLEYLIKSN